MRDGNLGLAITLAILASTNMNVGKALQKWKVKVLRKGLAAFRAGSRRDLAIWLGGVLLTVSATPLFSLALNNTDQPSLVSAMNGVGLIGLILFAGLVLKEKIGGQELLGAGLIFLGTTLMGIFEEPPRLGQHINLEGLIFIELVLLGLAGPGAFIAWRTRKAHGLAFGVLVGILLGTAVILGKLALVAAGNDFIAQFKNPYPYTAILVGFAALVLTQFAFWRSTAMVVVPTMNSIMILAPALLQYFALQQLMKPVQLLAMGLIVAGVIFLTATEKADKLEGKREPEESLEAAG